MCVCVCVYVFVSPFSHLSPSPSLPPSFSFPPSLPLPNLQVSEKAAEAAAAAASLPQTGDTISLSSNGPPPNYDELEFLSRSLPEKTLSLSQDS